MSFHHINGVPLFVKDTGGDGVPVIFSHGLLWSHRLFGPQVNALQDRFRCVSYDHRGQGQSGSDGSRVVEIEQITQDAADLIHALQLAPCHFVGLSMGGFVGMRLAARHPELLRSLTLIATAADPEPPENHPRYKTLIQVTRIFGVRAVRRAVMPIMFGKTFLNDPERKPLRKQWSRELVSNRRRAVCAVRGVIERSSVEDELHQIQCPTLILHGAEDAAISVPRVNALHQGIPNAKLVRFATGGHTLTIEEPRQVNAELLRFLEQVS